MPLAIWTVSGILGLPTIVVAPSKIFKLALASMRLNFGSRIDWLPAIQPPTPVAGRSADLSLTVRTDCLTPAATLPDSRIPTDPFHR